MELWKTIPGYEGQYEASNLGRIRSCDRVVAPCRPCKGQIKTLYLTNRGYWTVTLYKNNRPKRWPVHTLIALTWLGPRPEGKVIRHGPKGKSVNTVTNLSYGTRSENAWDINRDGSKHFTPVKCSDGRYFDRISDAARATDSWPETILRVCQGKFKQTNGLGWEFA